MSTKTPRESTDNRSASATDTSRPRQSAEVDTPHGSDASESHGNSPAAWTAVVIMLVAFAVGTVAFCFALPVVVWISFGVLLLGLVTGWVLKRMGYGVGGHRYVPKAHN